MYWPSKHNQQLPHGPTWKPGFKQRWFVVVVVVVWTPVEEGAWTGMMCVGADVTVPSGHCNPDLKPTSNWTQPLVLSLALKYHWEREISSGGKAQGGFRWAFLGGDIIWSFKTSLGLSAWRVLSCMKEKFRSASFGIVGLMTIWAASQREVLKQTCL